MRGSGDRPSTLVLWVLAAAVIAWMFLVWDEPVAQSVTSKQQSIEAVPPRPTEKPQLETSQPIIAVLATSTPRPRKQPTPDMTCRADDAAGVICKQPEIVPTANRVTTPTPYPLCFTAAVLPGDWCQWPGTAQETE